MGKPKETEMNETDTRILVLSDSHGDILSLRKAVEAEQPAHILHLGDHYADAQELSRLYPHIPLHGVRGNTDDPLWGQAKQSVWIGGFHLFLTHGHNYYVKTGLSFLTAHARETRADAVLFGHTHRAFLEFDGIHIFNPGCVSGRLAGYGAASYGVIELKNGVLTPAIKLLADAGV